METDEATLQTTFDVTDIEQTLQSASDRLKAIKQVHGLWKKIF